MNGNPEAARLAALRCCLVPALQADPALDAVVRSCAAALGIAGAVLWFIEADAVCIGAATSLLAEPGFGRDDPFARAALDAPDAMHVVPDARLDPRLLDHPLVAGPAAIRFYAGMPLRNPQGYVLGVLCALHTAPHELSPTGRRLIEDLAQVAAAILCLRETAQRRSEALALSSYRAWSAAADGSVFEVGEPTVRAFGSVDTPRDPAPDAAFGSEPADVLSLLHPEERAAASREWHRLVAHGQSYDRESRMRMADGEYRWIRVHATPVRDNAGHIARWSGLAEDVTERHAVRVRAEQLAYVDEVTGLANRAWFRRMLDMRIAEAGRDRPFALLRIDLDDFKSINDSLGQATGDLVLRQVGERIAHCIRQIDLVARDGADEFLLLLPEIQQPAHITTLTDRIQTVLSEPLQVEGALLGLSASVGITLCPADATAADKLLQNADLALFRAKTDGRGACCFFERAMDDKLRARQALKLDLRGALERGEFSVAFQPLVDAASFRLTGFEALLRWRHPVRGLIPPSEFIPAAESTGQILALGRWILLEACREATRWPDALRVAVNLSVLQFRQRALPGIVAQALDATGLHPNRLELEVTESVTLLDDENNLQLLAQLRALGTRIGLDDFGTGYASLANLQRFPFDKLKIDRSFIARIAEEHDARTIIRAVLRMSRALNISTTAEGVETLQQVDILRREGCDELQGYFFGHPVPAYDIPHTLLEFAARREREHWLAELDPSA